MAIERRRVLLSLAAVAGLFTAMLVGPRTEVGADTLPRRLTDKAYWQLVEDLSEAGGSFRSDNFISNETTFQEVVPTLKQRIPAGGIYLGVGPDQNFTYIAAFRPRMAFIVDIRRQNMLEQLMYKAVLEASEDRADFLSRLFSRPRPAGLTRTSSVQALFDGFMKVESDQQLFDRNLREMTDRLVKRHGFRLSAQDLSGLEYVYRAFYAEGPELRYSFPRQIPGRLFPSYADLMLETDQAGVQQSYLANDDNFRTLRDFERNNLLVPIVGDFAGDKALRAVGRYLRERGATVTFFYTSNVEQYLFMDDAWQRFFGNVATLPLDRNSTFIRSFFDRGFRYPPGIITPDLHSVQLLDPILNTLAAVRSGAIQSYNDIVERSKPSLP